MDKLQNMILFFKHVICCYTLNKAINIIAWVVLLVERHARDERGEGDEVLILLAHKLL